MKFLIAISLLLAPALRAATLPVGTELHLRLTSEASSNQPSGSAVSAVVIAPVFLNGVPALSAGTKVTGDTADARPYQAATAQAAEQTAALRIQFTRIEDRAGHSAPLSSVVESVDNARETVDDSGLISGIAESQTFEARMDQGISKLASRYQGFASVLSAVEGSLVKHVDPSIDYKPGVELTVKLTKALTWNGPATGINIHEIEPAAALVGLVNSEPFRTVAQSPPKPSDLTNLMFLGTRQQIESAFQQAGWFAATALSRDSKFKTAQAMIEDRGYQEAPMSILYLDAQPPAMTFEKQNDTFDMRHHIRIWERPQRFNGAPVWVAAATHDTGITLSQTSHTFTHGIDPHIDEERSKVVNDLLYTGLVHALALVDRSGIPKDVSNATGDKLVTDGKQAVLSF